jgi:hypothetical protein
MDVDALQAVEVEHLGRLGLRRLAAAGHQRVPPGEVHAPRPEGVTFL